MQFEEFCGWVALDEERREWWSEHAYDDDYTAVAAVPELKWELWDRAEEVVEFVTELASWTPEVERGAALLDEHEWGWWTKIDLGLLDISDSTFCICGQLFNRRAMLWAQARGVSATSGYAWATDHWQPLEGQNPSRFGFDGNHAILDYLWERIIKERFEVYGTGGGIDE